MHPTRREMLRLGLGSSTLLACGLTVPRFLARSAETLADGRTAANGRILVVVQLDGGNDGLNTVVPYRDDAYRKMRPKLAIPAGEVKQVDDRVGLHPMLEPFAKLLERERLAIVQSVGYPNPNRSHFDSMAIWHTARTDAGKAAPGWLARALDRRTGPDGDAAGLHIDEAFPLPAALSGGRQVVPSMARLEQFHRRLGMPPGAEAIAQTKALDCLALQDRGAPGSALQFVERCSLITYASSARLERLQQDRPAAKADYPEYYGLARRLQLIAQLIKAGLTTAIYYTILVLPRHFIADTPHAWLVHIPRYLAAINTRLGKLAAGHVARDARHMREVEIMWQTYLHRRQRHLSHKIHDPQLAHFRWMIEELRVSVFAQELSTSMPISIKRLEKQLTLIRA